MSFSGPLVDMDSDEALIAEFKRGKTQAFEKIFMRYHGAIVYFAQDFVKDADAAKDLASEVFMKIWHLREDFENLKAVKAFLYVSARNACLNHLRRSRMVQGHQKGTIHEFTKDEIDDRVLNRIFDTEVLREVYKAIDTLPAQCKRVVRLTLQGLTTDDIAATMNLSAQTVRNTRVRATELLRKRLAQDSLSVALVALLVYFGNL